MDASRTRIEAKRLRPLVERVLKRYPFLTREVEHLVTHSNVMFRVVTDSGQQLVLRIGTPHANSRANIELEVAWLDALNGETDLEVVKPIRTVGNRLIVDEYDEHIDKERSCVMFSWVPGRPMADGAGTFAYRLLGEMCGVLQLHGRTWDPPPDAVVRRWDRVFYYDESFDPVIIDDPKYAHIFNRPRRRTITTARSIAESVIEDSYNHPSPQIVHGDLHEWNVHIARSRLFAFDFEDVMMALPAQDVSICLYSSRSSELRDDIRAAFRKGFETVSPWPVVDDSQLDGFHAARQIMLMNYAARSLPTAEADQFIDQVMPWLEAYVKRYG
jgi:Ser/Thr protein kinase RdoA (MazF antagonist)